MEYQLIKSNRRSISLEINIHGKLIVRAPKRMIRSEIDAFVNSKENWINKTLKKFEESKAQTMEQADIYSKDIRELSRGLKEILPDKLDKYATLLNVSYGKITIRRQKSLWGSCSTKGNLNFNCLLMLMPDEIIDYVVVHELCHRIHMNHSKDFWNEVERILPDYKLRRKWLKVNGRIIMNRVHEREE